MDKGMNRETKVAGFGCGAIMFFLAVAIVLGVVGCQVYKSTERTVTAHITDKERVCDSDTDGKVTCKYLIFTEDQGTFELTDSIAFGNFESSDVYGKIKRDHTYRFQVAGWRWGFASMYPNIVSTPEEVPE